jgi:hypothetical protein
MKILGIPNRIFFALANSIFCVAVEIWLNHVDALTVPVPDEAPDAWCRGPKAP